MAARLSLFVYVCCFILGFFKDSFFCGGRAGWRVGVCCHVFRRASEVNQVFPRGSKYPTIRYLPKTIITIPNMETLNTSYIARYFGPLGFVLHDLGRSVLGMQGHLVSQMRGNLNFGCSGAFSLGAMTYMEAESWIW